ncbi:MAG: energy transducer TonB [Vicingaceae bacterium]|nr:energy transducer TonB [Vicingaceae bacterium]
MKSILAATLLVFTFQASSQNLQKAENELILFIDSIFSKNETSTRLEEKTFFSNYKKVNSFKEFDKYISKKLKKKESFPTDKFIPHSQLTILKESSHNVFIKLEDELYITMIKYDLGKTPNFINQLYIAIHDYNYWSLSRFKPYYFNQIPHLNFSTRINSELLSKIRLIIISEKIFYYNNYKPKSDLIELKHQSISINNSETVKLPDEIMVEKELDKLDSLEKRDYINAISPSFPGGPRAMAYFIRDNFYYPELAREYGEQGTVWIEFVVYTTGIIKDVKVVKAVSKNLTLESIRVIESMPKWIPGRIDDKPVNVRYTIPIKCRLG